MVSKVGPMAIAVAIAAVIFAVCSATVYADNETLRSNRENILSSTGSHSNSGVALTAGQTSSQTGNAALSLTYLTDSNNGGQHTAGGNDGGGDGGGEGGDGGEGSDKDKRDDDNEKNTAVPEPATIFLFATGAAGLTAKIRKSRKGIEG